MTIKIQCKNTTFFSNTQIFMYWRNFFLRFQKLFLTIFKFFYWDFYCNFVKRNSEKNYAKKIARETQLKKWSRTKKNGLVNRVNPQWDNLV